MRHAAEQRPHPNGYSGETVTKAPPWHGLVAWDMFFNGLTTGLFLATAIAELILPAIFAPLARVAYPLALVLLLIDLGCLVGDLGDPLRFHHMLRVFKLGSPMSVGTWCLTIYSLPLTLVAVVSILNWPAFASVRDFVPSGALTLLEWVRTPAVVLALLPAFGSAVYKGVLISTNSQPGWKQARWLGGYLTSAAPLLGTTILFSLALLLKQERAVATLRNCLIPLLALNFVILILLFRDLRQALESRWLVRERRWISLTSIGCGLIAPLALWPFARSATPAMALVASILAGGLFTRFVIILLPHPPHAQEDPSPS
jgi:Ni/Fe-hydrogenase subunit HybB-like protein